MKKINLLSKSVFALFSLLFLATFLNAQTIHRMNLKDLQHELNKTNDSILVINFFATWCKPCVNELPILTKMASDSSSLKYKFMFISVDNPETEDKKLLKFSNKHKLPNFNLLLDSQQNYWMQALEKRWQGSIPATLILNQSNKKKRFFEGEITLEELQGLLHSVK